MPSEASDSQLWTAVLAGDSAAFEQIVVRYQGVVSAIAYSRLGDLGAAQDVAQEAFWVAWSSRAQLREPDRLAAWLCGIARNLSHQQSRRFDGRPTMSSADTFEQEANEYDPLQQSIDAERAAIVWQAVQELPEHYRDVIVLYYREHHSVSQVAAALELSEDAVKQRLSRGRAMLRDELASVVEETLVGSRPSRSFTAKVMSGLVAMGVATQATSASAAGVGTAVGAAGGALLGKAASGVATGAFTGSLLGLLGGMAGGLGGLGGAWLGNYLPAELAPTETERQLLHRRGRKIFRVAIGFTFALIAMVVVFQIWMRNVWLYLICLSIWLTLFLIVTIRHGLRVHKEIQAIRARLKPEDDPNTSTLRDRFPLVKKLTNKRMLGRKYTSSMRLGGWPLIDIQFSDSSVDGTMPKLRTARGWIAIGDRAVGLIAIGGQAFGLIAFGGLSIGGVAFGGGALGILSIGGAAMGVIALGGGAIGWQAVGGGAIAIDAAFGGGAIAWHMAGGGFALAHDIAAGGGGAAAEFNTPAAKQAIDSFWLKQGMDSFKPYFWTIYLFSALPMILAKYCYKVEEMSYDSKQGSSDESRGWTELP